MSPLIEDMKYGPRQLTRNPGFITVAILTLALGGWSGCAVRHSVSYERYQLAPVGGTDFLFPPGFSRASSGNLEMHVMLGKLGRIPRPKNISSCSIHGRWFSFYPRGSGKAGNWSATVPGPEAWHHRDLLEHARSEWNRFLNRLDGLYIKGCVSFKGYRQARSIITESIPVPIFYASLFQTSISRAGFVTLKPRMRLFVERSIFRTSGGKETKANYLGDTKVYYRVVAGGRNDVTLKASGNHRSRGLSRKAARQFPADAMLASRYKRMALIRLFFWTLYVPPGLTRHALLVGVRNPSDMIQVTRRIAENPKIPCRDLASSGIACTSFNGMVNASMEINIRVNGRGKYFSVGSTVWSVLISLPPRKQAAAWKTLRIRRLFQGRYYDVEFRRDDPQVQHLLLIAGDRISWGAVSVPR